MARPDDTNPATTPYVNLTTYRRDGRAVTTPVWLVARGERFYVGTTSTTGKTKRIRANGRVRFVPCDGRGRREFGQAYAGTARIVDDAALRNDVRRMLVRKYGRLVFAMIMAIYWLRGQYRYRAVLELICHPAA